MKNERIVLVVSLLLVGAMISTSFFLSQSKEKTEEIMLLNKAVENLTSLSDLLTEQNEILEFEREQFKAALEWQSEATKTMDKNNVGVLEFAAEFLDRYAQAMVKNADFRASKIAN